MFALNLSIIEVCVERAFLGKLENDTSTLGCIDAVLFGNSGRIPWSYGPFVDFCLC